MLFVWLPGMPSNGIKQIILLYARGHKPRAVSLPGESRLVTFAPGGAQLVLDLHPVTGRDWRAMRR